jgi:hypothetical protein
VENKDVPAFIAYDYCKAKSDRETWHLYIANGNPNGFAARNLEMPKI